MNLIFSIIVIIIATAFWLLIIYHMILTVAGLIYKSRAQKERLIVDHYPSVDILIPAHNEEKILFETLDAMSKLKYPGKLNIYLLNDNSTDNTGRIADYFEKRFKHIHHVRVPEGSPKGKSRVLNYGVKISDGELIVIYDADNQPQEDAVLKLVEKTLQNEKFAGAAGSVKTINMYKNNLTRMIGLEFMVFQLLMQSGRWLLFKLGTYPGTNMLIKRKVILEVGGWDEYALAEDTELSMRIMSKGYLIPIVPYSITREQEPEDLKTLIKQRSRWIHGNFYVISKIFKERKLAKGIINKINIIQMVSVYYIFVFFLLISDVWFILGLLGKLSFPYHIPLLVLWFESILLYVIQIVSAVVSEKEVNLKNILFSFLMYFTYAQLWIYLVIKAYIYQIRHINKKPDIKWEKTPRF